MIKLKIELKDVVIILIFGRGHDLRIYDKCTSNNISYYYSCCYNTTEQYDINSGQNNFYVDDLEVYSVKFE